MATAAPTLELPAPFAWQGEHVAIDLGHGARALFTTRRGGVSQAPFDTLNLGPWTEDAPADVERNRRRLAELAGARALAQAHQVHGTAVRRLDAEPDGATPDADGHATALRGVGLVALTADCLPVALATPGAVAMVHAGWKGLARGVLDEGVRALRDVGGDDGPMVAAIGPGAGPCCYEVGDEVREQLGLDALGAPATVDLKASARERLLDLDADAVHDVGLCTMCTDRSLFFSHRRDGPRTGRQGGVAWRS